MLRQSQGTALWRLQESMLWYSQAIYNALAIPSDGSPATPTYYDGPATFSDTALVISSDDAPPIPSDAVAVIPDTDASVTTGVVMLSQYSGDPRRLCSVNPS